MKHTIATSLLYRKIDLKLDFFLLNETRSVAIEFIHVTKKKQKHKIYYTRRMNE